MDTNRLPKQALQYKPKGRRNIGRPRKRWRDQLHLEDQGRGNTTNSSGTWWWWVDGYYRCVVNKQFFFLHDCVMYCTSVIRLLHGAESSPFCNSYYLFTLSFLSKQTRHGRNIVSYIVLFICGRAKCLSLEQRVGSSARVDTLCSSCSLKKYLERWPTALNEAGPSVLMLKKGSMIPRIELNTVHL